MLGLPARVRACLFDLDGMLTQTAKVHAAAWKEMFDDCLPERAAREGAAFVPFDALQDYDAYVDGRPREDGVRTFRAARGAWLPEGAPDDPPQTEIDAVLVHERRLRGKPAPDTCLEAARAPAVDEDAAAVFEDALAGVEAGRAGRFGFVVGVDRVGQAEQLRACGANLVVRDLAELMESR
ncbi:hypothetical protein [Streptomyces collinus]|uniref:hypothetical protein n=1 Tax=Streptomyces collinus TaxID=42684 RepID=UPI0029437A1E|nr:hypothetical protein [Streptomyces collinus]